MTGLSEQVWQNVYEMLDRYEEEWTLHKKETVNARLWWGKFNMEDLGRITKRWEVDIIALKAYSTKSLCSSRNPAVLDIT